MCKVLKVITELSDELYTQITVIRYFAKFANDLINLQNGVKPILLTVHGIEKLQHDFCLKFDADLTISSVIFAIIFY